MKPFKEFWTVSVWPTIHADIYRFLKTEPTRIALKKTKKQR